MKKGTFIGFRIDPNELLEIMEKTKQDIEKNVDKIDLRKYYLKSSQKRKTL